MPVIALADSTAAGSIAAKLKAIFFGPLTRHKPNPSSQQAPVPRVIRQRLDWVCTAVWLSMPFVSAAFYYGLGRLIWKLL